eukprot:912427-Prorocentrum_minimum.AAC.3
MLHTSNEASTVICSQVRRQISEHIGCEHWQYQIEFRLTRKAPVPDKVCTVATRCCKIGTRKHK